MAGPAVCRDGLRAGHRGVRLSGPRGRGGFAERTGPGNPGVSHPAFSRGAGLGGAALAGLRRRAPAEGAGRQHRRAHGPGQPGRAPQAPGPAGIGRHAGGHRRRALCQHRHRQGGAVGQAQSPAHRHHLPQGRPPAPEPFRPAGHAGDNRRPPRGHRHVAERPHQAAWQRPSFTGRLLALRHGRVLPRGPGQRHRHRPDAGAGPALQGPPSRRHAALRGHRRRGVRSRGLLRPGAGALLPGPPGRPAQFHRLLCRGRASAGPGPSPPPCLPSRTCIGSRPGPPRPTGAWPTTTACPT